METRLEHLEAAIIELLGSADRFIHPDGRTLVQVHSRKGAVPWRKVVDQIVEHYELDQAEVLAAADKLRGAAHLQPRWFAEAEGE